MFQFFAKWWPTCALARSSFSCGSAGASTSSANRPITSSTSSFRHSKPARTRAAAPGRLARPFLTRRLQALLGHNNHWAAYRAAACSPGAGAPLLLRSALVASGRAGEARAARARPGPRAGRHPSSAQEPPLGLGHGARSAPSDVASPPAPPSMYAARSSSASSMAGPGCAAEPPARRTAALTDARPTCARGGAPQRRGAAVSAPSRRPAPLSQGGASPSALQRAAVCDSPDLPCPAVPCRLDLRHPSELYVKDRKDGWL